LPRAAASRLRAGRRLNLSKATVSEQVQALENALGVRLLNRTSRRVSLTGIDRGYYERYVQFLQDLEEADEAAGAQQATPRGQLRLLPPGYRAVRHTGRRSTSSPGTRKPRSICAPALR
jgi:DNA-binding transcriptional LysR family regulator